MRRFRFGYQATDSELARVVEAGRAAEAAGFDIVHVGDHVGIETSPLLVLAALASTTRSIRVGTLVLNNDLRHPVVLAQELATLDHLSGGRLEVGLGAGHSFTEYRAIGLRFEPAAARKARLAESVEILRALLDGETVTFHGSHYELEEASTLAAQQEHVPLLVGVNGRAALAHAARHADIVAPTMLGRTHEDGHRHDVRWEADRLDATVSLLRSEAGPHWDSLELHALVQDVMVTGDRVGAASRVAERTGMTVGDILATPFLCIGTPEEMAQHLVACRERWGFSYFSVRSVDAFAPVIDLARSFSP